MLRVIYSAILYLYLPLVLLRLLVRSISKPALRARWKERLGYPQNPGNHGSLAWIHAVSVGEVRAAKPLVDLLQREYPGMQILFTTMTWTGAETVSQLFGNTVVHRYAPYDLPGAVNRFIRTTRPCCLMVMETELWPNLFYYCRISNVPVILANGRMSGQSTRRYGLVPGLTRPTLQNITKICAQTAKDAERFIALGAAIENVSISGNLKYDFTLPDDFDARLGFIKPDWPRGRPVWIAASTHEGEEQIILQAHAKVLEKYPECLLIIAPRHPERFSAVTALCARSGFRTLRKTGKAAPDNTTQVFILDTMGDLIFYYALSQLAFVGGSLVRVGGHNMLEPAALGVPVIAGPYLHNFQEIGSRMRETGAARVVANAHELLTEVIRLFSDEKLRLDAGQTGRNMVVENRGSADRCMQLLRTILNKCATNPVELI
ncbi:MAG: lipid IV(A) 3-deoxy-D-manno-octulosonic acid transferase [Gammaproteobacteria bacterium]